MKKKKKKMQRSMFKQKQAYDWKQLNERIHWVNSCLLSGVFIFTFIL